MDNPKVPKTRIRIKPAKMQQKTKALKKKLFLQKLKPGSSKYCAK